jgi:hypothetical protein
MRKDTNEVKHFWQEYRAAVASQGVPDSRADWLARWAQRFACAAPGVPLRARTEAHVRAFLSDLEGSGPRGSVVGRAGPILHEPDLGEGFRESYLL